MKRGHETQGAQRAVQAAGRDGGDKRGEDAGRTVARIRYASDNDQHTEAGTGSAGGGTVRARGEEGGRGRATEDDRRVVSAHRPAQSTGDHHAGNPDEASSDRRQPQLAKQDGRAVKQGVRKQSTEGHVAGTTPSVTPPSE